MMSKEKYIKYLEEVSKYNDSLIEDYTCSTCKINKIRKGVDSYMDPLRQEKSMWNGGTVTKLTFGFGSIHDTDSFYMAVCDDCLIKLIVDNKVVNIKTLKSKIA